MTIRKYILISIPVICTISIIVSFILSQPKKDAKKQRENQATKEKSLQQKKANDTAKGQKTVSQTVEELSMQNYDEKGKETLVMRGKSTQLQSDNVYKILSPEIEVKDTANTEEDATSVFITSDNGEMDNTSNEGYLSQNVVVHLDAETQLNTDHLRYLPDKKFVETDDSVVIDGKGIKIVGQGCEIDLVNKKMWIRKDAEMEMDGEKNDLFFLSRDNAQQGSPSDQEGTTPRKESSPVNTEKTVIRSSGQLIFDRQADAKVMTFNDNVEVKKGDSTVLSDKLVIFLDPETRQTKQAIASGNVLASQGTKIAKGSFLTWDVNTQSAILEDNRKAEFVNDELNIDALKLIFYKNTSNIDVPSSGNLLAKMKDKPGKKRTRDADGKNQNVNVKWEGKMNFLAERRAASFEKEIEVKREDSTLFCENLDVTFNENDYNLRTLKASDKIHIIEKRSNLFSEAVGDQATWDSQNKLTVLQGHPFAFLREGNRRQIMSPRILFYEDDNTILCEGKGTLFEGGSGSPAQKGAEEDAVKVDWVKKMIYNDSSRKVSFYESVQVVRGGQKLNGDQVDAYLNQEKEIHQIISTGNVYFFSKGLDGCEGLGSLLTWDLAKNIAILTGSPKAELRKEGSRTFSEKVFFDMAESRVTWEGRPHWQLMTDEAKDDRKNPLDQ